MQVLGMNKEEGKDKVSDLSEFSQLKEDVKYNRIGGDSGDSGESGVMMLNEECEDDNGSDKQPEQQQKQQQQKQQVCQIAKIDDDSRAQKLRQLKWNDLKQNWNNLESGGGNKSNYQSARKPSSLNGKNPVFVSAIIDYGYKTDTYGSSNVTKLPDSNLVLSKDNQSKVNNDIGQLNPNPDLVNKLVKINSNWFFTDISRESVQYLLSINYPGNFIVRRCSKRDCLALSIKQEPGLEPEIEHYLIQVTKEYVKLEESKYTFPDLPFLLAFYIQNLEELPCKLRLPQLIERTNDNVDLELLNTLGKDLWVIHETLMKSFQNPTQPRNEDVLHSKGGFKPSPNINHRSEAHSIAYKSHPPKPMHLSSPPPASTVRTSDDKNYVLATLENKLGIVIDNHPKRMYPRYPNNVIPIRAVVYDNCHDRDVSIDGTTNSAKGTKLKMRLNYGKKKQEYPLMLHEQDVTCSPSIKDKTNLSPIMLSSVTTVLASVAQRKKIETNKPKETMGVCDLQNNSEEPTLLKCHFRQNSISQVIRNENIKQSLSSTESLNYSKIRKKKVKKKPIHVSPLKNEGASTSSSSDSQFSKSKAENTSPTRPLKKVKPKTRHRNAKSEVSRNLTNEITPVKKSPSPIVNSKPPNEVPLFPALPHKVEIGKTKRVPCNHLKAKTVEIGQERVSPNNIEYRNLASETAEDRSVFSTLKNSVTLRKENSPNYDMFDKLLQEELDKLEEMGRSCDTTTLSKVDYNESICQESSLPRENKDDDGKLKVEDGLLLKAVGSQVVVQIDTLNDTKIQDDLVVQNKKPEVLDTGTLIGAVPPFSNRVKRGVFLPNPKSSLILNKFYRVFNSGKNTLTSSWEWIPPFKNTPQCNVKAPTKLPKDSPLNRGVFVQHYGKLNLQKERPSFKASILNSPSIISNTSLEQGPLLNHPKNKVTCQEKSILKKCDNLIIDPKSRKDRPTSNDTVFSQPWDLPKDHIRLSSYYTYPKTRASNITPKLNNSLHVSHTNVCSKTINYATCKEHASKITSPKSNNLSNKCAEENGLDHAKSSDNGLELKTHVPPNLSPKVLTVENLGADKITSEQTDDVWKMIDNKNLSFSSSQESLERLSARQSVNTQSVITCGDVKQFWTLRSSSKNAKHPNSLCNGHVCPTLASRTSSVIFVGQNMSPRIAHPIWSTLRMKNQSQTITGYILKLARDKDTFIGSTIKNFVECVKTRKAGIQGGNPYEIMKNTRQLMDGLKNYLSNMTAWTRIHSSSPGIGVASQSLFKNEQDKKLDELVRRECEKLGPNKFLNLDTLLEAVMQSLIIKPLNGVIKEQLITLHNSNGDIGKIASCLKYMKSNLTLNTADPLASKPPPVFGCEKLCKNNTEALFEALDIYFVKLKGTYSPVKKLKNLLKIFNTIKEFLEINNWNSNMTNKLFGNENNVGPSMCHTSMISRMDGIVPIFIYGLANSSFVNIEIEADYMWSLLHPQFKDGIEGYHLITLLSMIEMMKNIDDVKNKVGNPVPLTTNGEGQSGCYDSIPKSTVKHNRSFFFKNPCARSSKSTNLLKTIEERKFSIKALSNYGGSASLQRNVESGDRKYNSVNAKLIMKDASYNTLNGDVSQINPTPLANPYFPNRANIWDYDGFWPVFVTHEADNRIISYIFPIRASMKTEETCKMIAFCFNIINSPDYGLFMVANDRELFLSPGSLLCQIVCRADVRSSRCQLIYKRKDAKIAWKAMQIYLTNHA